VQKLFDIKFPTHFSSRSEKLLWRENINEKIFIFLLLRHFKLTLTEHVNLELPAGCTEALSCEAQLGTAI
jgi:hypothetical protein